MQPLQLPKTALRTRFQEQLLLGAGKHGMLPTCVITSPPLLHLVLQELCLSNAIIISSLETHWAFMGVS